MPFIWCLQGCRQTVWQTVCLTRSREAAKARFRFSVFGVQSGEPRRGVRGCVFSVARAFQPEICPSATGPTGDRGTGAGDFAGCLAHAKPRSREGKRKGLVFGVRCSAGRAADGSPRVWCCGRLVFDGNPAAEVPAV